MLPLPSHPPPSRSPEVGLSSFPLLIGSLRRYVSLNDTLLVLQVCGLYINGFFTHCSVGEIHTYWQVAVVLTAVGLRHCRNLLKYTICCGLLGCLQFGAISKNAALNLLELVSWCTYASKHLSGVYTHEWNRWEGCGQSLLRSCEIFFHSPRSI